MCNLQTSHFLSNPARANEIVVGVTSIRNENRLIFQISEDGLYIEPLFFLAFLELRLHTIKCVQNLEINF